MKKLSAVIIAHNEEDNIGRCIDSLRDVADEILVVDSFSTDKTVEIATAKGARVIQHAFEGHIQQKNWAKDQAENGWVLSLDADEALSPELQQSISQWKLQSHSKHLGYEMNRLNFYCGQPVKTCGWYPDKKLRLWSHRDGNWTGINPHDKFVLDAPHTSAFLTGDILHNTYPAREAFLQQREKFATISAQHLKHKSILYLVFKLLFSPPVKFIRTYIFESGFTDGSMGLYICYHLTREVFLKYFRAIKFKYQ